MLSEGFINISDHCSKITKITEHLSSLLKASLSDHLYEIPFCLSSHFRHLNFLMGDLKYLPAGDPEGARLCYIPL